MSRVECYNKLSEPEKTAYLFGAMLYDENTKNGKTSISRRRMHRLNDRMLSALLVFMAKTREENPEPHGDLVFLETLVRLKLEIIRRRVPGKPGQSKTEVSYERFKASYPWLFKQ